MFLIPDFAPRTVENLTVELDEEAALLKKAQELKHKFQAVQDYMRNVSPLGVVRDGSVLDGEEDVQEQMSEDDSQPASEDDDEEI
jgi:hypothetical protein